MIDTTIEEFPCLVHKLSVALTALQYKAHCNKVKNLPTAGYSGMRMVHLFFLVYCYHFFSFIV